MDPKLDARKKELIGLDGPALSRKAWELNLDPRDLAGRRYFAWQKRSWGEAAIDANGNIWRPHERVDQADDCFRSLRTRGYTTSCCWFGDDRPYGDAFVAGIGDWRACYGVRWPLDVKTEAIALLMVSVLAVEGARAAAERDQQPEPEEPLC